MIGELFIMDLRIFVKENKKIVFILMKFLRVFKIRERVLFGVKGSFF